MEQKCEKFTVSGHVQGVGFRYFTCKQGNELEANGYAKNLPNGNVEVVVCGTEKQIEMMAKWLESGPRTATVTHLVRDPVAYKSFSGFCSL